MVLKTIRLLFFLSLALPFLLGTIKYSHATAYEKQVAWLLIAQDTEELNSGRSWYFNFKNESKLEELVRIFESRMKPLGLETRVIIEVKAKDLKDVLSNPYTNAVFWVGHASQSVQLEGLGFKGVIVDSEGTDVSHLFKTIHPNVRWVGIVGCHTKNMIEAFKKENHYIGNPVLQIYGSDGYAVASKDLVYNLGQAYWSLATLRTKYPGLICDTESEKVKKHGILLTITRNYSDSSNKSAVAFSAGRFSVGFMAQDEDKIQIWVPYYVNLNLIEAVKADITSSNLNEFVILNNGQGIRWDVLRNKDNEILGHERNIYIQRSDIIFNDAKSSNCMIPG